MSPLAKKSRVFKDLKCAAELTVQRLPSIVHFSCTLVFNVAGQYKKNAARYLG